jgi:hypothetical protein
VVIVAPDPGANYFLETDPGSCENTLQVKKSQHYSFAGPVIFESAYLKYGVFHSTGRFPKGFQEDELVYGSQIIVYYTVVERRSIIVVVIAFSGHLQIMRAWSCKYWLYFR